MHVQYVLLWTDACVYVLVLAALVAVVWIMCHAHLRAPWRQVFKRKLAMVALVVLLSYIGLGMLDSVHFRSALPGQAQGKIHYATQVTSLLDVVVSPIGQFHEKTYSAPLAIHLFSKQSQRLADNTIVRIHPRLVYAGRHLQTIQSHWRDVLLRCVVAIGAGVLLWAIVSALLTRLISWRTHKGWWQQIKSIAIGKTSVAWREIFVTLGIVMVALFVVVSLVGHYYLFGTGKVGQDVFFEAIKSIRTGLIIGTLTTLLMLPFALLLGTMAGYFRGLIDDIIQYVYITLSSIPAVLLITATILVLDVTISQNPKMFPTLATRADARLLALCIILGITSWTSLCRLLRAETLKLRETDFVQAATALGVRRGKIILRHVLPNVMHIILITIVLDFSALVLAEAVLSYVGVGVDPTTLSWGNMINSARLELAREPIVWWPLLAAFIFMFVLVLSANLFADAVRDAFDPRLRHLVDNA